MSTETTPNTQAIEKKANDLVTQAKAITITDPQSYQRAGEFLVSVKGLLREIDDTFDSVIKKAHEAHKAAVGAKKKHAEPLLLAESVVKRAIAAYAQAEEQRRRQEAAEAAAKARREAEERALAEAAALEAAGETEQAEQVLQEAEMAPVAPPPPMAPMAKATGVAVREVWTAEVVDLKALVRAVADGQAPATLLKVDQAALNQLARALKAELAIPGVKARRDSTVAARAGAW